MATDVTVRGTSAATVPASPGQVAAAGLLGVVADPLRFRILVLLAGSELCTMHLQDMLSAKQTLVSHHLKVLREAGVVLTAPCGRFTYYRLRPGALDGLSAVVSELASASHGDVVRRAC